MAPLDDAARDAMAARVREQIAAGRSMAALREAKELAKRCPGPPSEALLIDAYQARIRELSASGMAKEAGELLELVRSRWPDQGATWNEAADAAAVRSGDIDRLAAEWVRADLPPARRAELAQLLQRELCDPREVVRSTVLGADDPLNRAASAVAGALDEAARGQLSEEKRACPHKEGRHFSFAPLAGPPSWTLFAGHAPQQNPGPGQEFHPNTFWPPFFPRNIFRSTVLTKRGRQPIKGPGPIPLGLKNPP